MKHFPAFASKIISNLNFDKNKKLILDLTFGCGGHSLLLLKSFPKIQIFAFDADKRNFSSIPNIYSNRISFFCDNFINVDKYLMPKYNNKIDAIILDLGYSTFQLNDDKLGLSFKQKADLNMNYLKFNNLSAKNIINKFPAAKLTEIFFKYGEEKYAKSIANNICKYRKEQMINSTDEIVKIIKNSVPAKYSRLKHPAKKTFQGLRIYINNELSNLKIILSKILSLLNSNGKLFVITFNSLEDRIVKLFFKKQTSFEIGNKIPHKNLSKSLSFKLLFKKPLFYSLEDLKNNSQLRSAKLRGIVKIK